MDGEAPKSQSAYYRVTTLNREDAESEPSEIVQVETSVVKLFIPDVTGKAGSEVVLPVSVANADYLELCSVDIWITYDADKLTALDVERTVLTSDYVWAKNVTTPGVVRAVVAVGSNGKKLFGEGALFNVRFSVKGGAGDVSDLAFDANGTFIYDCKDLLTEVSLDLTQTGAFTITSDGGYMQGDVEGDVEGDGDVDNPDSDLLRYPPPSPT